ncbi:MAG TPA: ATP-binding protein [Nitrospirota bacterium]|nr:ATP-binding protein [Nitrospirota bacterium]
MTSLHAHTPLLIAMAGLPGTGKSTLAAALAKRLPALVLDKDDIRTRLFSPGEIEYSVRQDDLCMDVAFLIAAYVLLAEPSRTIILDGRTFSQPGQVEHFLSRSAELRARPVIIECICDDAVAAQRLERDQRTAQHPARNRSFALYLHLKGNAQPLTRARLVLDTSRLTREESVEQAVAYITTASALREGDDESHSIVQDAGGGLSFERGSQIENEEKTT